MIWVIYDQHFVSTRILFNHAIQMHKALSSFLSILKWLGLPLLQMKEGIEKGIAWSLLNRVLTTRPKTIVINQCSTLSTKESSNQSATIGLWLDPPDLRHGTIDVIHNNLPFSNCPTGNQTLWLWLDPHGLCHKTILKPVTISSWTIVPLGIKLVTLDLIPIIGFNSYH